jgi:hypothetical protein
MAVQVRLGGTWNTITAAKVFAGSSWRSLKAIQVFANGAWRVVANFTPPGGGGGGGGALSLAVSPNPCQGTGFSSTVTTPNCTVTPSGGQAPFTYAWTTQTGLFQINSPSSSKTTFTRNAVPLNGEIDVVAKCVVTDSLNVSSSITVNVQFIHESAGGG